MKRAYIISHSDGSKLAAENRPPCGGASAELLSIADFFVFLDFLHGALSPSGFYDRDFRGGAILE
jgi:hypothetical protein